MYSYRISKWKLYQNFLIISWISSPHSSEFKYKNWYRCHEPTSQAQALTIATLVLHDAAIIGSTVSKVAFLKPYSQPWVLPSKMMVIAMCMRNWACLTDIVVSEEEWKQCYHWLGVQAEVGSSECIRLIPLIAQGTRVQSWGCGHQSSKLSSSSEISPTCNVPLS